MARGNRRESIFLDKENAYTVCEGIGGSVSQLLRRAVVKAKEPARCHLDSLIS
jgi:hypothetical protein